MLVAEFVKGQNGPFANVWSGMIEHRDDLLAQVSCEVRGDDVRQAVQCNGDIRRVCGQVLPKMNH